MRSRKPRAYYGVLEKQFRNAYHERAERRPGQAGQNLLAASWRAVWTTSIYRLGFAHEPRARRVSS